MKIKSLLFILFLALGQMLAACGAPAAADPAQVVQDYWDAINAHDLDAAMALVADDVQCRNACYLDGKESFRFYVGPFTNENRRFEISDIVVDGNTVAYDWEEYRDGLLYKTGAGESIVVEDGKIILLNSQYP